MKGFSRRQFVGGAGGAVASLALPTYAWAAGSQFKIGVISDEISQDFDHACFVVAKKLPPFVLAMMRRPRPTQAAQVSAIKS